MCHKSESVHLVEIDENLDHVQSGSEHGDPPYPQSPMICHDLYCLQCEVWPPRIVLWDGKPHLLALDGQVSPQLILDHQTYREGSIEVSH